MVKGETSFAHQPTHEPIQRLVKGGCLMMGISTLNLEVMPFGTSCHISMSVLSMGTKALLSSKCLQKPMMVRSKIWKFFQQH
jgi:hypothetical protein